MSSESGNKLGLGCVVLFALPFAIVGVVMAYFTAMALWEWYDAQGWIETPATILEAKLVEHSGDDGATHEATARYRYTYAGQQYESERVAIHGGADNIGSYQRDIGAELEQIKRDGKPFRCFVNPGQPSEALLFRDLRPGMLAIKAMFGLIFGGVGFGIIGGMIFLKRSGAEQEVLEQAHPDEPWKWQEDWAAGMIKSNRGAGAVGLTLFALFWNAISWTVFGAFMMSDEPDEWWAMLFVSLFPLVGLCLAGGAVYLWLAYRRWGISTFEMAEVPGVVGGKLAGVVHAPGGLKPAEGFAVTLSCIRKVESGSGEDRSTRDDILWQTDAVIIRELVEDDPTATIIPVEFYIPYSTQPTDDDSRTRWEVGVHAKVPGIDYRAEFVVPVFRTPESSSEAAPVNTIAEYKAPDTIEGALTRCGAIVERNAPDNLRMVFPRARNLGVAIFTTVFLVIWTGAIVAMIHFGAPLLFPIVFGLFELLMLWVFMEVWFRRSTVEVVGKRLEAQSSYFGWGAPRSFSLEDVVRFHVEKGMQSGNKHYYRVVLVAADDKDYNLCQGIAGRSSAERIARELTERMGIELRTYPDRILPTETQKNERSNEHKS